MPSPTENASEIVQAGRDARGRGEQVTTCPYPDDSGERERWLEGWHQPDDQEVPDELGFA